MRVGNEQERRMRVQDPVGGPPDLARFFHAYEKYFSGLPRYEHHLQRVVAGYSRGDGADELREAFAFAVSKLVETDEENRAQSDDARILAHHGRYPAVFREALVFLSFALCLRVPRGDVEAILQRCERGDPLLETLAHAAAPHLEAVHGPPAFYDIFDGLYDALRLDGGEREIRLKEYLEVWYEDRMEGFPFKDLHRLHDQPHYVGYWCFEVAGIAAALDVDDTSFADHPHYPRDLVAMYRSSS